MSLSFNAGGLITRGYGNDHRIITRGMSIKFDFGGIGPREKKIIRISKEYFLNIFAPISKNNFETINLYSSLEIKKEKDIEILLNILKEAEENFNISAGLNHNKLSIILDAI